MSAETGTSSPERFPGVALITGAGGTGIGAAVARAFARAGCPRLAITDINKSTLADTRSSILRINPQAQVLVLYGDLTDDAFALRLVDAVVETFQRVDYLVQCAGVLGAPRRSHETPASEFDRVNGVNYRAAWLRGAVVHVASQLGLVAKAGAAPYCASKGAVIGMTRADAVDYAPDGIRVNCVCPGIVATPMTTGTRELEEAVRPAIPIAPMNRMASPDEIAGPILFLCSPEASFVQGHALVVDGGYTIN
ncbi:short-chain dehydrogenase [Cordyceps fumosorosea ARSEF 2679]|uniref:Short-chain dehydrogenase n=1 Tax=Cordyceps fumosorosea (strain ARSEF 2679) TaxID=1081104 RepID=A0A167SC65_CORFA|nr:short-chain dehydrogenase [Cordyceps fumosorosea ARSEF 2679]OAA59475.1 short-chain dehydrogenase [Cordyceps fumosorosea ARSEF 2679]